MNTNKSIFLVLGMIAAVSVVAAAGIAAPVLASSSNYDEKYLRCYQYSEKNNEHSDYDYYFNYKNYYYYCWDYDNNSNKDNNGY
jgi:hypothetical protein